VIGSVLRALLRTILLALGLADGVFLSEV